MESDHYIIFIEVLAGDKVLRHYFKEGDEKAEALFSVEEGVPEKPKHFAISMIFGSQIDTSNYLQYKYIE